MQIKVTVQEVMEKGSVEINEARRMIGCGRTMVYDMLKDGTLPFVKNKSRKMIPVAALEKYLTQNLVQQ